MGFTQQTLVTRQLRKHLEFRYSLIGGAIISQRKYHSVDITVRAGTVNGGWDMW